MEGGIIYLVIGGLAGFYIGRSCEYRLWAGRGRVERVKGGSSDRMNKST